MSGHTRAVLPGPLWEYDDGWWVDEGSADGCCARKEGIRRSRQHTLWFGMWLLSSSSWCRSFLQFTIRNEWAVIRHRGERDSSGWAGVEAVGNVIERMIAGRRTCLEESRRIADINCLGMEVTRTSFTVEIDDVDDMNLKCRLCWLILLLDRPPDCIPFNLPNYFYLSWWWTLTHRLVWHLMWQV